MVFYFLSFIPSSYNRKNQTNSYNFLQIKRVHVHVLSCSVSFKPSLVYFALLTALVLSSHGSDDKKYVATGRRITDALKEEKRSGYEQSTLRIKDFKYGSSLSIFVRKNNEAQRSQSEPFFTVTNNTRAEFNSGSEFKE